MDNKRFVFLVWVGCYSDKQVIAVFDTSDAAESLVKSINDEMKSEWQNTYVEETKINNIVPELHTYLCLMRDDGNIIDIVRRRGEVVVSSKAEYSMQPSYFKSGLCFSAYGATREHAIKNCADYRRAMLAQPDFTMGV